MPSPNSQSRHLCSELVLVVPTRTTGSPALTGNLEEIGEWSAEILTDSSIPRNTPVRIVGQDHQLEGIIESCRRDKVLGYFLTIRLEASSRWSEQQYRPEHFLKVPDGVPSKVSHLKVASGY